MSVLTTNNIYLTIGGTNVAAKFIDFKINPSSAPVDTTHGAATDVQRQAGLRDTTYTITLAYDIPTISGYIALLKPGTIETIDYGPENNVSGKPRHTQSVHIDDTSGPDLTVKKDMAVFQIKASAADAATNDMYNGATF